MADIKYPFGGAFEFDFSESQRKAYEEISNSFRKGMDERMFYGFDPANASTSYAPPRHKQYEGFGVVNLDKEIFRYWRCEVGGTPVLMVCHSAKTSGSSHYSTTYLSGMWTLWKQRNHGETFSQFLHQVDGWNILTDDQAKNVEANYRAQGATFLESVVGEAWKLFEGFHKDAENPMFQQLVEKMFVKGK